MRTTSLGEPLLALCTLFEHPRQQWVLWADALPYGMLQVRSLFSIFLCYCHEEAPPLAGIISLAFCSCHFFPVSPHPHPIHSSLNSAEILEGGCQLDYLLPYSKLRPPVILGIEHKLLPSMLTSVHGAPRLPCCPHSYWHESPAPPISSSASVLATGCPDIPYPHCLDPDSSLPTVSLFSCLLVVHCLFLRLGGKPSEGGALTSHMLTAPSKHSLDESEGGAPACRARCSLPCPTGSVHSASGPEVMLFSLLGMPFPFRLCL